MISTPARPRAMWGTDPQGKCVRGFDPRCGGLVGGVGGEELLARLRSHDGVPEGDGRHSEGHLGERKAGTIGLGGDGTRNVGQCLQYDALNSIHGE